VNAPIGAASLDVLASDYWNTYLEGHPLVASALGEGRLDDRLPDPTAEGTEEMLGRLDALRLRSDALDPGDLEGEGRITLSALRASISSDIAELETGLHTWNVDPLEGVPAGLLLVPSFQRLGTPADGWRMATRWREMAVYTDRHLETLRRSLADGRVACRAPAARVLAILDELLAEPVDRWPLLDPLGRVAADAAWTTVDRDRFSTELRDAVVDDIRPAFIRLRDALATEILPASRPVEQPGMCHVAGGLEAYRQLIRVHTSLDVDAETLHRIGLEEIARIDDELASLAGRTLGTRSLDVALRQLRGDPSLYFETRDQVEATAVESLVRAEQAIPAWFGRLPRARCEVARMGPHEEAHSTIAYYRQPAADGSRPGHYFINTSEPSTRPRYEAQVLAYHESIPGHHLQVAIGQELVGLPEFRLHLGPTAFFEGWGLYTERLADEMGLYAGDLDRIGVLSYDAWRASRLVVDTGMHALGWPRDRAVRFMLEHTALAPNNIENEVDRYIALPGQALAYKAGQLELLRLRADARERLGSAFDIRSFHDAVLGNGAIALPTLHEVVEAWIDERTAQA
jgi:uncharacterized protein (DUF885 family)